MAKNKTYLFIILLIAIFASVLVAQTTIANAETAYSFNVETNDEGYTITGLSGPVASNTNIEIPETINGIPVTKIAAGAFKNAAMASIGFQGTNLTEIGAGAFLDCQNLVGIAFPANVAKIEANTFSTNTPDIIALQPTLLVSAPGVNVTEISGYAFAFRPIMQGSKIPSSLRKIGFGAFAECSFHESFYFPQNNQLVEIGSSAFSGTNIKTLVLPASITTVGRWAFNCCDSLTLYVEHNSKPSGWSSDWNNSNRPVIWGCTLSADKSYVVSVNKTDSSISNASATGGITAPYREDYTFGGWYTTSDFSGTQYTDITQAPNGTLYAKWTEKSCVAEGTMVTLADGSEVAVESLSGNEQLLVWNLLTGSYDVAPILFVDCDELSSYRVIELTFSDGTEVKVIDEHGFWCYELNEYVYLDENASNYIGYHFNKKSGDSYTSVTLVGVEIYYETTRAYSPVTYGHLCYFVNGMLSMPGGIGGLFNIFEVDSTTMSYDQEAMEEDIEEYGLYTYEEFSEEIVAIPEEIFNAFNGAYLKVAIGKGLITEEEIVDLAVRYSEFF